jgi:hypothetical protein
MKEAGREKTVPGVVLTATLDLTGNWEVEANFDDSSLSGGGFDCAFKQDGQRLAGTCSGGSAQLTGELKGQNMSWTMKAVTYTGTVNETGTSMKGRFTIDGKGGSFSALKSK